jgi:hypothetical protein
MYRSIHTLSSSSRRLFTRAHALLSRQDGSLNIQRVRIVHPIFTKKGKRKVAIWAASIALWAYILKSIPLDEEEEDENQTQAQVKAAVGRVQAGKDLEKVATAGDGSGTTQVVQETQAEAGEGEEDQEDIIPKTQPEGAWFIPLGWTRAQPQEQYKAADPEWKAFVGLNRDGERTERVKSKATNAECIGGY